MTKTNRTIRPRRMARTPTAAADSKDLAAAVTEPAEIASAPSALTPDRQPTKINTVIALLRREEGAALADLCEATGWQPHSTRAALTGLRKKGHLIQKDKRDEVTCWRITDAA